MCVLSCSVLSNSAIPVDCSPPDSLCPWGFSRQEYWSGLLCPPAGDLPNPGIEPRSLALQVDSHQGSPWILEWVASSFSRGTSWPKNQTGVSCIAGGFFTSWTSQEALDLLYGSVQWKWKVKVLVAQSCPTLCNPMDFRPPGSSVHGILQARILEWCFSFWFTPILYINTRIYMEVRKMVMTILYVRPKKRHRCTEQTFGLCGRRQRRDDLRE